MLSLEDGNDITRARVRLLTEALAGSGIACESRSWPELSRQPEELRRLAGEFDVISAAVTQTAIEAVQILERDLRLRVPDTIAAAGIDNTPGSWQLRPQLTVVDLCNGENGRLCIRKFSELITAGSRPFHLDGKLALIRRESC